MASEPIKRPAGSPANKEEIKKTREQCVICSEFATADIFECLWCEGRQHASCTMISSDQCKAIANLSTPNVVFFCSSCIQMVPAALKSYDSQSFFDSKVSILEKSMSKIQETESNLHKFVKDVETQLEKHEKAITTLFNDHKSTQVSATSSPTPSITEESVANIAASITAEQKEKEKRQLNIIVHNITESSASEGPSRKEDDIKKCKSLFEAHLGITVSIQNAIRLGKRSDKPRLLKIALNSIQEKSMVLKNKLKLRSSNNPPAVRNVFITPDYTPLEQKKNKALRQQLADMNKVENIYTIKNGKIVQRTPR